MFHEDSVTFCELSWKTTWDLREITAGKIPRAMQGKVIFHRKQNLEQFYHMKNILLHFYEKTTNLITMLIDMIKEWKNWD